MARGPRLPLVNPMSAARIEDMAQTIRKIAYPHLAAKLEPFPAAEFLEFDLKRTLGYEWDIRECLPEGLEAWTDCDSKLIVLSEAVYQGLWNNHPRDRFTVCHEVGHAALGHAEALKQQTRRGKALPRLPRGEFPVYMNPEWQANRFAAALLMPERIIRTMITRGLTSGEIAENLQVSHRAAQIRRDTFTKH